MEYITIYDVHTQQNGFNNNGLAVLCPISCEITEKANGEYSLSMVHPIDEYGIWRNINCFNHVKALGQIFTIRDVEHVYTGNQGKINVYADHIFYKMNDPWIFPDLAEPNTVISGSTATEIIQNAMNLADHVPFPDSIDYTFDFDSDVAVPQAYSREITEGCTLLDAIIGDDGFIGEFGGELYRDNFHFSIRQEREGTQRNAFDIRVGLNLIGVKRRVDVTRFCSYFRAYDHLGQWWAVSYHQDSYSALPVANSVVRSQNFSFDTDDAELSMDNLARAGLHYFGKNFKPNISYTVDLRDVKNNPDFKQFGNHFRYRVGDYGRLYDERIGGALELRITETVKDAITGETLKVVFGDLSGFVKESSYTPVPEFPTLPRPATYLEYTTVLDPVTWQFEDYTGKTAIDYQKYRGQNFEKVKLPTNIVTVGAMAFMSCENLVSVERVQSIITLGQYAFYGCKNLAIFDSFDNIETFGDYAFQNCEKLKEIQFSSKTKSLGLSTFKGCTSIEEVVIPETITQCNSYNFMDCTALHTLVIKSAVACTSNSLVENCSNLKSVTIDCQPEAIGNFMFSHCSSLEEIDIPSSVKRTGQGAFQYCTSLKSIQLPSNFETFGEIDFCGCTSLENITIPSKVKTIASGTFQECSALKSVTLPEGLTTIEDSAFYGCTSLKSISIPESVTSISRYAFNFCDGITFTLSSSEMLRNYPYGARNASYIIRN